MVRRISLVLFLCASAFGDETPSPAPDLPASPAPVAAVAPPPAAVAPRALPAFAPPPATMIPEQAPPSPGRTKRIVGVVTTLVGAVFVVTAAALGNQSSDDNTAVGELFAQGGVWNGAAQSIDREGHRDDVAQKVLYPIGGAMLVTGVTLAIVGWLQDKHHASAVHAQRGSRTSWSVSF
jgi:hypothetical protein